MTDYIYNWIVQDYRHESPQVAAYWCADAPIGDHNSPQHLYEILHSIQESNLCLLVHGLSDGPKFRLLHGVGYSMAGINHMCEMTWRDTTWVGVEFRRDVRSIDTALGYLGPII